MARLSIIAGVVLLVTGALVLAGSLLTNADDPLPRRSVTRPIDPSQQTALAFGERSHWLQPWRAYLDTPPATRLRDAIGINFNVEPKEAEATARLLSESGFRRARVEFGWDAMSFSRPDRLARTARFQTLLGALARHDIRPLILLNANHGAPGPTRFFNARLREPAPQGARRVRLDPATTRRAVPGCTGLNAESGKAADVIFTRVRGDGTATLSKPLPRRLEAGSHPAATLRFEPFGPPRLAGGRRNPRFERTLGGWLSYARTIVREARAVVGSDAFDVEIWNELTFGSDFLFQQTYYRPARERGKGDVTREILERTVRALRAESGEIGIGDGFASQTPFPAGSTSPPGLTAIDKHPYYGIKRFPRDAIFNQITPLDALGRPDSKPEKAAGGEVSQRDKLVPTYNAFFPEYILSAIQTETLIRDLSPITTDVYGVRHGRRTHVRGSSPPTVWVTEANLDPTGADPSKPGESGGDPVARLTPRDVEHLHAKAALRYYTAFVSKGVSAVHLFGAKGDNLALIRPEFFSQLGRSGAYPGARVAGETPAAVARLAGALEGAKPLARKQPLRLLSVSDVHWRTQFDGDGTRAHPPLYDRDVVAFLPFQVRRGEWVAAAYVMTRDLATLYRSDAPEDDRSRYDLPPERFRLRIGGLGGQDAEVSATDLLTGESVPIDVGSRSRRGLTLDLPLTDSPRIVRLRAR